MAFKGIKQRYRPLLSSADSQLPVAHCSPYTQAAHFGATSSDPVGGGKIIPTINLKSSTFVTESHKFGKHANMPSGNISPAWVVALSMLFALLALCFGVLLVHCHLPFQTSY